MCVLVCVVRLVCVCVCGARVSVSRTSRSIALTHSSTSLQQSPWTSLPSHSPCQLKGQSTPASSTAHQHVAAALRPLPALLLKAIPAAAMSPGPRPPAPRLRLTPLVPLRLLAVGPDAMCVSKLTYSDPLRITCHIDTYLLCCCSSHSIPCCLFLDFDDQIV